MKDVGSTALARARTSTRAAPARFNARASLRRRARGDHIVDDDDRLALDVPSALWRHLEGASHVAPPLVRREPDLACRPPYALEHEAIDRNAREPPDRMRQHRRLIEAPRPEPRCVERHRHDKVGFGEKLGASLLQPAAEEWQTFVPIPVFEALDQLAHGRGIARDGARPVVQWGLGDGGGGEKRRAGIVRKRHAEPVAHGWRNEVDLGKAGAADEPVLADARPADDADRRQKKVCERCEDRAEG